MRTLQTLSNANNLKMKKMKKIITILTITLISVSCKAQSILPIEDVVNYRDTETGIPKNITQIKDVNGLLNKFIGVWKGTYNNKKYEFRIVKNTRQSKTRNLTEERLLVRYKITNNVGTVIEDTTTLPNDSWYIIKGSYYDKDDGYILYYQGKKYQCGQNGNVFISTYGINDNKLQLFLAVTGDIMGDCPNGLAQQILPTKSMELIKQ